MQKHNCSGKQAKIYRLSSLGNSLAFKYNARLWWEEQISLCFHNLSSFQHARSWEKPMLVMQTLTQEYVFSILWWNSSLSHRFIFSIELKDWRLKILLVFISCDEKRKCMINWLMCKVKAYSKHPITESNNDIKEIKVRQNVWNVG